MASAHRRVVKSEVGAGPGVLMATPTRPGSGSGYESPSEDNIPHFLSHPTASTSVAFAEPVSLSSPAARRPALAQRPSYIAATPPVTPRTGTTTPGLNHGQSLASSLNQVILALEKAPANHKVSIKDRLACHKWTYFTLNMSTGGIANIIHGLKWQGSWINGLGLFFFFLNLVLFVINCILLCIRFRLRPGSFISSFTDQVESLFIPAFFVAIAVILINICQYGIPNSGTWLLRAMEIIFWIHGGVSVCVSAGMYLILWSTLIFPVHTMTPTWVFPAYPLLLNAPLAANLIAAANSSGRSLSLNPTAVAFGAATIQGTGCLIAFMISAAFIYRLMTQKLPRDAQRPGIFMSIGPYGFTAAGIAQLGNQADTIIPSTFIGTPDIAPIIKVICVLVSMWLWGLALWFFVVCVGALWKYLRTGNHIPFQITWWSFVFPNTALITATSVMGNVFESNGLHIFAGAMTVVITLVWVYIFSKMLWALKTRKLLWPKHDI